MAEEYHSIVIVGAGMTGLYASRILSKQYSDVIVVEAQDHVGGRVRQIEGHAPWPIEVGPEFIHGANSELVHLVDELGFKYHEREWPDFWYFGPEKRLIHDSAGDEDVARVHEMFSTVMSEMPPAPMEPDISARDWMKLRGANEKMIAIADACYANDMAGSMDQLGLRELVQEDRCWDSGETYLILDRSIKHIADALALGANIRTSWPVNHIQYSRNGAMLHGPNGSKIRCAKVIVTVPHKILQIDMIRFTPPMPPTKRAAIQRVRMGNVVKVILSFSRRFWPEAMYDVICTHSFVPEMWMTKYPISDPTCAHLHAITGFISGERADAASLNTDEENVSRFLTQLDQIFGSPLDPRPATDSLAKSVVFDWAKQEFVRGAYTFPSMGAELGDRDLLAQPLMNTVFFAGEGTHPSINPCMQAALETGKRAAMLVTMAMKPLGSKL